MNSVVSVRVIAPKDRAREAAKAKIARTPVAKAIGLLGRRWLSPNYGMLLWRCRAIHTAFMRFAIDAVFLDRSLRVVGVSPSVKPFRIVVGPEGTRHVLELPSGTAKQMCLHPGCSLSLSSAEG